LHLAKPMNSRERVLAALRREPVDRTPVCNPTSVATVALMDLADAPFPEANRVPELMARLGATSYTELGFDTTSCLISPPSSSLRPWAARSNGDRRTTGRPRSQASPSGGIRTRSGSLQTSWATTIPSACSMRLRSSRGNSTARWPSSARPWDHGLSRMIVSGWKFPAHVCG